MHHGKAEINSVISQLQHFFMSTNKMAALVDSEAAPVDTFVPEARLDDNHRRKLIAFYKEKPILWDTSLKLQKKAAKAGASSTANSLISWWYAPLSSLLLIQLLVQITLSRLLKTSSSSKLSIKWRVCRNFTFLRWFDLLSAILLAGMLTLLLIARAMLR